MDIEQAKKDPSSQYHSPHEVVEDGSLSLDEKVDILRRWAYDAREIAVAEEENMAADNQTHHILLEKIQKCLLELGVSSDNRSSPPTKQG